jgi:hypothetical protein
VRLISGFIIFLAQFPKGIFTPGPKQSSLVFGDAEAPSDTNINYVIVDDKFWLVKRTEHAGSPKIEIAIWANGRCVVIARNLLNVFKFQGHRLSCVGNMLSQP